MSKDEQPAFNPLHGIPEAADYDISKHEWLGLSREGYIPPGLTEEQKIAHATFAERERCARIAEEWSEENWDNGQRSCWETDAAKEIAAAIRSGK